MKDTHVNSISRLDVICRILVVVFFGGCALIFNGSFNESLFASGGVVFIMILIGLSIEIIIQALKHVKGIGTINYQRAGACLFSRRSCGR